MLNAAAQRILPDKSARRGVELERAAPELLEWLERSIAGERAQAQTLRLNDRDLRPKPQLLGTSRPNGALIYLHDEQALLRQAHEVNLASLGRLSASLAHNIRNPLSAVTHASQLLAESAGLAPEDQKLIAIIRRNAQRLDETVNSVLELSNRHRAELRRIEFKRWLQEACDEYRELHALSCEELALDLPTDSCWADAAPAICAKS